VAELRKAAESRPDLQSLAEQEAAADSAVRLARARRLPDPTVRLGYTRDQFVMAGNQRNSLSLGISLPLPFSERGQADAALALSARSTAQMARRLRLDQAQRDLDRLLDDSRSLKLRQTTMRQEYVPLARSLVARLTASVKAGGVPLPELLLARRTLNELLSDANDLDRSIFENTLALRRCSGAQPITPPPPLQRELQSP